MCFLTHPSGLSGQTFLSLTRGKVEDSLRFQAYLQPPALNPTSFLSPHGVLGSSRQMDEKPKPQKPMTAALASTQFIHFSMTYINNPIALNQSINKSYKQSSCTLTKLLSGSADVLQGNNCLPSLVVLGPNCLCICGKVMQIHTVYVCKAVCWLRFLVRGRKQDPTLTHTHTHTTTTMLLLGHWIFFFLAPRNVSISQIHKNSVRMQTNKETLLFRQPTNKAQTMG